MKKNQLKNIALGEQTHSDNFFEITANYDGRIIKNNDGFFTTQKDQWLGVWTADCMPIFVVCQKPKIAGLLHSGRKGVELDITGKYVKYLLQNFPIKITDIFVVVGPHISSEYYEINLQNQLELKLLKLGFPPKNLIKTDLCTFKNNDEFFSYRKNNRTDERMLSGIKIN